MSEDELLRELGRLAQREGVEGDKPQRRGSVFDERWDRLAAGLASVEEEAELRALAESSEEARAAHEAFQPLGPGFQSGVVRAIRSQASREAGRAPWLARRGARTAAWSVAAAAAAAALVVVLRPPALPGYSLAEVAGGSRATRDGGSEERTFAPGDPFVLTLRPQTEVRRGGSLAARVYLLRRGELWPVEVRSELDPGGSVRLTGVLPPRLESTEVALSIVVGRLGSMPDLEELDVSGGPVPVRRRSWVAVPVTLPTRPRAP